ncbi:hypothetical protein BDV93DRAFT_433948, partial [Ceratobasidium sp. AG-I]
HVLLGVTYTKIGTIQRRLAWPLHKDDTLVQSGRSTDRNIYFVSFSGNSSTFEFHVLLRWFISPESAAVIWSMEGSFFWFKHSLVSTDHPEWR